MLRNFLKNGSGFLTRRQTTILSAATIIMVMIGASRILGLVRNRVLAHYFTAETLSLYFAGFRLPEVVFEVLVFGTLSSAFIPTFTRYLYLKKKKLAWEVAGICLNLAVLIFLTGGLVFFFLTPLIYRLIGAGFTPAEIDQIVNLARVLFLAQGFFVLSYFLTGVLESLQRFLVPAVAPLFYNLGIIFGAVFLVSRWGIYAPAIGAVVGAFLHFAVQLPVALHLGFRPHFKFNFFHPGVKKIARLAWPRIAELSFLQIGKSVELFFASLISTAAYTWYTFAVSLQLLPVSLFGASIAKASLPALSQQASLKNFSLFKKTFLASFKEILFLVMPFGVFLAVLRIPLVRLTFGTARFTWVSTVETGRALSAFCLGISAQALIYLLARAFYALHDTKTPVKVSVGSLFLNISLSSLLVLVLKWPVWSLALSFSLTSIFQAAILVYLLGLRVQGLDYRQMLKAFFKITFSALVAGAVIFFLLKLFDRSAWDKNLSFLGYFGLVLPTSFDRFVLDTRYTVNLLWLTFLVSFIGGLVYLGLARLLKIEEITIFFRLWQKIKTKGFSPFLKTAKKKEVITLEPET